MRKRGPSYKIKCVLEILATPVVGRFCSMITSDWLSGPQEKYHELKDDVERADGRIQNGNGPTMKNVCWLPTTGNTSQETNECYASPAIWTARRDMFRMANRVLNPESRRTYSMS